MNTLALPILWALVRTGLVLSLSAVVVAVFLRVFRVASPTVRRTAYVAVLLQGWLFFESPFSLPLPTPLRAREEKVVRRKESTQTDRGPARTSSLLSTFYSLTRPAVVFGSSASGPHKEEVRPISGIHDAHALETLGQRTSVALRKDTGGPKLPPVAPERDPAATVAVIADTLPIDEPRSPWSLALLGLWATGIALIAGRSAWAYVRFVRRFPVPSEAPPDWADEWTSLQLEAGLPGIASLVVAEQAGPVLCRLPRGYCLIVPGEAWRTLEPSQRWLILRHELAHIERHDVWKSLAMRILALPHWFNPFAWRMVRRFDESAEWACDEAAAGADPERIPDYARALLQLGHRAQPAFFAAPAARTHGLAHRIRRLLNPAANKGIKMKTTLMAALLLGISLINVTRLQTRAEGNSAADDQQQTSQAPQAAADKPAATVQESKQHRGFVTVQAPITQVNVVPSSVSKLNVVPSPVTELHTVPFPVTKANTVPAPTTAIKTVPPPAPPAKTAPIARRITVMVPHSETIMVPATVSAAEPKQAFVDKSTGQRTKTPPPAATPPTKPARHNARPGKAVRVTGKAGLRIEAGSSVVEMSDGEIHFLEGANGAVNVVATPREARVNLGYILQHMHQFQREQAELKASLAEIERREAGEAGDIEIAKKRLDQETDIGFRTFLERAIAQSRVEMQREHREGSDKLIQQEKEMFHRNLQRTVEEIARYAKEHKILIVRRVLNSNENRAGAAPTQNAPPPAPPFSTAPFGAPPEPAAASTPALSSASPAATTAPVAAAPAVVPATTRNRFTSTMNAWDQEILYVADLHADGGLDISDEIVKRLNAADEAKGKTPRATPK
jgi:beta-lactamase regulating signal transducer with metallopeptidase domain